MTSPVQVWAPVRRAPPQPVLPSHWIDVSNWQGALSPGWFDEWERRGFGGLIVQAVTGQDGQSYTQQQLDMAIECDWSVAAYVWCSPGDALTPSRILNRLALLDPYTSKLEFLALDLEASGVNTEDVDADLALCDSYLQDETVVYTAYWFFEQQGWLSNTRWCDRPLWDADYDGTSNVDYGFRPYGGWTERWLKQYTDDPLDQNVMRRA